MIADWARATRTVLAELGTSAGAVVAGVEAVMDDVFEVWHPFADPVRRAGPGRAARAATLATGPGVSLPLLGG